MTDFERNDMSFLNTKEVAELLHCSVPQARCVMRSEGFPSVHCGKNLKVMKCLFKQWAA